MRGRDHLASCEAAPRMAFCARFGRGTGHHRKEDYVGVVVSLDGKSSQGPSLDTLLSLTQSGMEGVNRMILSRVGSDVEMIPEIAKHLIESGGKRLRPMLTLATAELGA